MNADSSSCRRPDGRFEGDTDCMGCPSNLYCACTVPSLNSTTDAGVGTVLEGLSFIVQRITLNNPFKYRSTSLRSPHTWAQSQVFRSVIRSDQDSLCDSLIEILEVPFAIITYVSSATLPLALLLCVLVPSGQPP
jgi:hypothetical protein